MRSPRQTCSQGHPRVPGGRDRRVGHAPLRVPLGRAGPVAGTEGPGSPRRPARTRPIIRLEDGQAGRAVRRRGPPRGLPARGLRAGARRDRVPTVRRAVADAPVARAFLEALHFTEPDIVSEVLEIILPRYALGGAKGDGPRPWRPWTGPRRRGPRAHHAGDGRGGRGRAPAGSWSGCWQRTAFLVGENAATGEQRLMPPPGAVPAAEPGPGDLPRREHRRLVRRGRVRAMAGPSCAACRGPRPGGGGRPGRQGRSGSPPRRRVRPARERGFDGSTRRRGSTGWSSRCSTPGPPAPSTCGASCWAEPAAGRRGGRSRGARAVRRARPGRGSQVGGRPGRGGRSLAPRAGRERSIRPADLSLDDLPPTFARDEGLAQALGMSQPVVSQASRGSAIPVGGAVGPEPSPGPGRWDRWRASSCRSAGRNPLRSVRPRIPRKLGLGPSGRVLSAAPRPAAPGVDRREEDGEEVRGGQPVEPAPVAGGEGRAALSSRVTVSPAAVTRRSSSGAPSDRPAAGWPAAPGPVRWRSRARSDRMNAASAPRGIPGISPTRLMTRTISSAASASSARPVRKFSPSRFSVSSTVTMLTLRPTKIRPLSAAVAPAAARKKAPHDAGLYPAIMGLRVSHDIALWGRPAGTAGRVARSLAEDVRAQQSRHGQHGQATSLTWARPCRARAATASTSPRLAAARSMSAPPRQTAVQTAARYPWASAAPMPRTPRRAAPAAAHAAPAGRPHRPPTPPGTA